MYYNGAITYNNVASSYYGLIITSPPQITHSEIYQDRFTIPGKDGELLGVDTYRGNAHIKVSMALVANGASTSYQSSLRPIRAWLSGTGILKISDGDGSYYEVERVTIETDERVIINYGNLVVDFEVYPYEFMSTAEEAITTFPITNNYEESMPEFWIRETGSAGGDGTLTINGHNLTYTTDSAKALIIDTRRKIAYNTDFVNKSNIVSGDYDDLHLKHGSNTISLTRGVLTVYPKWGYFI